MIIKGCLSGLELRQRIDTHCVVLSDLRTPSQLTVLGTSFIHSKVILILLYWYLSSMLSRKFCNVTDLVTLSSPVLEIFICSCFSWTKRQLVTPYIYMIHVYVVCIVIVWQHFFIKYNLILALQLTFIFKSECDVSTHCFSRNTSCFKFT